MKNVAIHTTTIYRDVSLTKIISHVGPIAWGHLISWYKQMYDVLLSIAGNYYSKFNKFTIYFWSKSVVVCDLELEIFLTVYNSRIIRIKVHVSRMGDVYRLDSSVP